MCVVASKNLLFIQTRQVRIGLLAHIKIPAGEGGESWKLRLSPEVTLAKAILQP